MIKNSDKKLAKKKILSMFSDALDVQNNYNKFSSSEYLEILNHIKSDMPFKKKGQNEKLVFFCYAGCIKFNRFTAPTPFVVDPKTHIHFKNFLEALFKAENGITHNSLSYFLRYYRSNMYQEFDSKQLNSISEARLEFYRRKAIEYNPPEHPEKRKEYIGEQKSILNIIEGISTGTFKTVFRTKIPFILSDTKLLLEFEWEKIPAKLIADPIFFNSSESFLKIEPVALPVGPTNWQAGYTDIEIQLNSLIDCDIFEEPLIALHNHEPPIKGWPKCFVIAYNIIRDISWHLRLKRDGLPHSIPTPRDLSDIEWEFKSEKKDRIEWKKKGSPALILRGFTPSQDQQKLNLGELKSIKWSKKCRSLSVLYSEMGQNQEAIFWLNVGIESFFEERFKEISNDTNDHSLLEKLSSTKAFWGAAEDVIRKQYPEFADKIKWPKNEIHISIFAKIRMLFKTIPMKVNQKDIYKHYSNIKKHRNDLFHGRAVSQIPAKDVNDAFKSFDWICENFEVDQ